MPARCAIQLVEATVVAPFHFCATAIGKSRMLIFLISSLPAMQQICSSLSPARSWPSSMAIVAGTAPVSRTICSKTASGFEILRPRQTVSYHGRLKRDERLVFFQSC